MATARGTRRADRSIRRELAELAERQGFVHHVADAASGQLLTTPLDRPPTPLSRADRLSRLGHPFDPSIFGGPTHRLTPRVPYQASPLAWLTVYDVNIARPDGEDLVYWSLPRDLNAPDPPGLKAHMDGPPPGRCLVTLSLGGNSWDDQTGHVRVRAFGGGPAMVAIRIPFGSFAEHTIDVTVVPVPGQPVEVLVELEPGLHQVTFRFITLAREFVFDPGTF